MLRDATSKVFNQEQANKIDGLTRSLLATGGACNSVRIEPGEADSTNYPHYNGDINAVLHMMREGDTVRRRKK